MDVEASRLKRLREERGLSMGEFCRASGTLMHSVLLLSV